jgi:hypothetical protein
MEHIKAVTFTGLKPGGLNQATESLTILAEETACNSVILVICALQDNAYSDYVDYKHDYMPKDQEIRDTIQYIKELGLKVILKPFVNCKDGTWRAHINFFDYDVICEPKWSKWFEYYTDYQLHYAKIAEEMGCEMIVIGCEMVQAQKREAQWRELIEKMRQLYTGLLTYTTDKYQEDRVTWWDAVDVISSTGYYPIDDWDRQLDRIEGVVKKYKKPFFFGEVGCKSCVGASLIPNDWKMQGKLSLEEQETYYRVMFNKCRNRKFVEGFGIWDWHSKLYREHDGLIDRGYELYGKPACQVVLTEWS